MKFNYPLFLILIVLGVTSCQKESRLFELKSPDFTGVDFNNLITETDSFNILTDEYIFNGGGVAIADFDQNGLSDLFFTGNQVPNKLFLNQGEFKFKDISKQSGIEAASHWCTGTTVVDINGDGWMDIYVASAMKTGEGERDNLLFVNQGLNGEGIVTFREMATNYGIADSGNSMGAAFVDYDLDGDLDLYVLNNEQSKITPSNYREKITDGSAINNDSFYRNNGDGTFTDVTIEAGITIEGFGLGLLISDLNNDGWPDIHVSNDYVTNDILYINNQDGTFSNQIKEKLKHQSQFSMGSDISDFNNDSKPDLITLDMLGEDNYRKKTTIGKNSYQVYISNEQWGYEYQHVRNMLHMNNGPQAPFSEIGMYAGIYQTDWSWSPLFGDVDNDGLRDLLITNGFPRDITDKDFANYRADVGNIASVRQLLDSIPIVKIPNYAFKNQGDLKFEDSGESWGLNKPSFSNGAALVDLDLDGDLDYVVNNINDPAFVFENTLNGKNQANQFLRIKLKGSSQNPQGLGAKVRLTLENGKELYQEQQVVRGYMSSIEDVMHFGLGEGQQTVKVSVTWPDGKISTLSNLAPGQLIEINYSEASAGKYPDSRIDQDPVDALFSEVSSEKGMVYIHEEMDKVDYNIQRTLPHKLTQFGPSLTVGDVNGDGLEDLLVGSSSGFEPKLFAQNSDGTFSSGNLLPGQNPAYEEMGMLLFDLDNDGDLDLYAVSGSNEFAPNSAEYLDRLFINDGKGNFELDKNFSQVKASGSAVRGADFDGDGFMDLFVGGRTPIAQYPYPENSFLLRNINGILSDVTDQVAPELRKAGMVTDAIWSDVDMDGQIDLVVVGEMMEISIFKNQAGSFKKLENTGLENYLGWWNSISSADFDQDGDMDFVVGNMGANNHYHSTAGMPVKVYGKDFDGNGSVDPVTFAWYKNREGKYESFPGHFWDDLYGQSILFRRKFERYKLYALTTENTLFTEEERKEALVLTGNYDRSVYLENLGQGKFSVKELPTLAQLGPVNGIVTDDINQDGLMDILLVGNDFGNEIFIGRLDALIGLALLGDGQGNFRPMGVEESGFVVPGDAKAIVKLNSATGSPLYIASQNRDKLKVFQAGSVEGKSVTPGQQVMALVVELENGKKQRIECTLGSGFLSQSSREVTLPSGVKSVKVIDYKGREESLDLSSLN
ncbi:FG-GAP-like repeat-containing protein [Algoriphagus sp. CAU 1675]|uniref:FG-GAP-like repeat-containing protein n=1 Tax=Algoriphagus sp. CAU 1675 TaxID=3032597 RepID=UPI0023DBD11B|nr:FG-GAP-like repeat-containing protein [Algoriphagus sp. CAU 1675]MDF2157457.1 FG-GAP-like repeat-containing protein [Algoriphagus sp. CAU 1675]